MIYGRLSLLSILHLLRQRNRNASKVASFVSSICEAHKVCWENRKSCIMQAKPTRPWDSSTATFPSWRYSTAPLMCFCCFTILHLWRWLFICSLISPEEFGVRLMVAIPVSTDSLVETNEPVETRNERSRANPHFLLLPNVECVYYSVNPPWFLCWNWSTRMDIIFPTERWGIRINIPTVG